DIEGSILADDLRSGNRTAPHDRGLPVVGASLGRLGADLDSLEGKQVTVRLVQAHGQGLVHIEVAIVDSDKSVAFIDIAGGDTAITGHLRITVVLLRADLEDRRIRRPCLDHLRRIEIEARAWKLI